MLHIYGVRVLYLRHRRIKQLVQVLIEYLEVMEFETSHSPESVL